MLQTSVDALRIARTADYRTVRLTYAVIVGDRNGTLTVEVKGRVDIPTPPSHDCRHLRTAFCGLRSGWHNHVVLRADNLLTSRSIRQSRAYNADDMLHNVGCTSFPEQDAGEGMQDLLGLVRKPLLELANFALPNAINNVFAQFAPAAVGQLAKASARSPQSPPTELKPRDDL